MKKGKVIGIDFGRKRVGLAISDELRIIATAFRTVEPSDVINVLKPLIESGEVTEIVVGLPLSLQGEYTDTTRMVDDFVTKLRNLWPEVDVHTIDERFTSKIAKDTILMSGVNRKTRRKKELVDQVSSVLILQSFMERQSK